MIVVGTGVAGLSAALAALERDTDVTVITEGDLDYDPVGNTPRAQGGIAAAIGAGDRPADHLADTLAAGAGLVDPGAAEVLTREGARIMRGLLADGFAADRVPEHGRAGLEPALGLEAAHGRARIVHAGGDRTGAVLHAHLAARVRAAASAGRLRLIERRRVGSLVVDAGTVRGVVLAAAGSVREERVFDDAVVLATGGYASLFPVSTNHPSSVGHGVVLAARAGAVLADLEFVQFHPTALVAAGGGSFLISEAVRGAGAVLRDDAGARFLEGQHPLAELAPRDVVALATHRALRRSGRSAVWLDATGIERDGGPGTLARQFPAISRVLTDLGFDWCREPVPVAPAAHYTMGGVASDLDGRTSVPGLFVAGEVASTGVHGANRLASNSLLEGLVFGTRAGAAAAAYRAQLDPWQVRGAGIAALFAEASVVEIPDNAAAVESGRLDDHRSGTSSESPDVARNKASGVHSALSETIGAQLGIEREASGIAEMRRSAERAMQTNDVHVVDRAALAAAIAHAADVREESRGAHRRADFPQVDERHATRRALRWVDRAGAGAHAVSARSHPFASGEPVARTPRSVSAC